MSASLVGSEMCIRDSPLCVRCVLGGWDRPQLSDARAKRFSTACGRAGCRPSVSFFCAMFGFVSSV
eukprot:3697197-Alexandrium_andersonii.AAC.1